MSSRSASIVFLAALATVVRAEAVPSLEPGVETTARLEDKDGRAFTLILEGGERAAVRLVRHEGSVALLLVDPAGTERRMWIRDPADGSDTICPRTGRPHAAWVADAPGSWTLRVLPPEGVPPFEVSLLREEPRAATEADRFAWNADLADAEVTALLDAGKAVEAAEASRALVAARERELAGEPLALASDLGYLGVRFYVSAQCRAGAWDVSEALVRRALELRSGALPPGDLCVAESLSLVASILYAQGTFEEAETFEKRSLAIREAALPGSEAPWTRSLRDVGLLLLQQGKYAEAEGYLRRALAAVEAALPAPEPNAVADARHNLAELLRNQDRYGAALAELERAQAIARDAAEPNHRLVSDILSSIAGVHADAAQYAEAERYAKLYLDLVAAHEELAVPDRLAAGKINLGEIYRRQGRLAEAEPLLVEALDIARDAFCPENPRLLYFRMDPALLYAEQGKYDRAEALYRESLESLERGLGPSHPDVAANLHELAGMLVAQARRDEARALYERALSIREAVYGPDHPVTASTRTRLTRVRFDDASPDLSELLASAKRARRALDGSSAYPEERVDALLLEADVLDRIGRRSAARRRLSEALEGVERLRPKRGGGEGARADFIRRRLDDYDRMIAWCLEDGDVACAFEYAERSRARALLDLLTAGTGDLRASIAPDVRARLEAQEADALAALAEAEGRAAYERARTDLAPAERASRLAELDARVDAAARKLQLAVDDFKNNSALWRDEMTATGDPIPLDAVQRELVPAEGLLLAYRIGREMSAVFVVRPAPARTVVERLVVSQEDAAVLGIAAGPLGAAELEALLAGAADLPSIPLVRRLAEPPGAPTEDAAGTIAELHALWRVLVPEKIRGAVLRAREVVVIPDGALAHLPIEALVVEPSRVWTDARTWLDAGPAVRYAASATSLANLARRVPARAQDPPRVLSVSNPAYAESLRLEPLSGTARESAAVVDAFRAAGLAGAVTLLDGPRATKSAVRAALPGKRYLHLATHGIVEPRRSELLAGLALTDGVLQLFEIQEQELDADLVVLSACDTNVGRRIAGEGVFSLARGFFAAGARRVVATLWPVEDDSAARLAGDFFLDLAKGDAGGHTANPVFALRDAKRLLRRQPETAEPFYWAAYTITGLR